MSEPTLVGVVGGGVMGSGIAQVFLDAGCRVLVIESDDQHVAGVRSRLTQQLGRAIERGHLSGDISILDRLDVGRHLDALAGASLVIESVPEDLELKRQVIAAIEAEVGEQALIASNTSSISVTRLAEGVRDRRRFLGMHFFNPVPRSDLVEVVHGPETGEAAIDAARAWVERIGKQVIVVRDSPGFASSRLGIALGLEAIRMMEEGVASAEAIDTAMVLGYKHPMGPLRLTDLVGLDVRLAIAEYLTDALGDRFSPPRLLREMVAEGKLGKKTGEGFYRW